MRKYEDIENVVLIRFLLKKTDKSQTERKS